MSIKYPVALDRKLSIDSTMNLPPIDRGAIYRDGDRLYVAAFINKKDLHNAEVLQEELTRIKDNALIFAESTFKDAVLSALNTETRIARMSKNPADWFVVIATVVFRDTTSDQILVIDQINRKEELSATYQAVIVGLEISPITVITLGIDPYHRGMRLKNLSFDSKNI